MKISTNIMILIWSAVIAVVLTFLILWLSSIGWGYATPTAIILFTNTAITGETPGMEPGITPTIERTMMPVVQFSTSTSAEPAINSTPGPLAQPPGPDAGPTLWPDGLVIGPWRDDSLVCDRNPSHKWVKIKGLNISGGIPPYDITFTQAGQMIALKRVEVAGEVEFVDPVVVAKGVPIIVTFTFDSGRGYWEENLYYHYLNDPRCSS